MTIDYVCGFLFNELMDKVVLIRKQRPEWQKGLLNGVGGKVEQSEQIHEAMSREFEEETGLKIDATKWHRLCNLDGRTDGIDTWTVWFYWTKGNIDNVYSKTDEEIVITHCNSLEYFKVVPNIKWLIPLAKSTDIHLPISVYAKK